MHVVLSAVIAAFPPAAYFLDPEEKSCTGVALLHFHTHAGGSAAPSLHALERLTWTLAETNSSAPPMENIPIPGEICRVIPAPDGVAQPQARPVHPPALTPPGRTAPSQTPPAFIPPVCTPSGLFYNEALETCYGSSPVRPAVISWTFPVQLALGIGFWIFRVRTPPGRGQTHPICTPLDRTRSPPDLTRVPSRTGISLSRISRVRIPLVWDPLACWRLQMLLRSLQRRLPETVAASSHLLDHSGRHLLVFSVLFLEPLLVFPT